MNQHAVPQNNIEQGTLLIEIATRNVICLAPGDSVGTAARVMAEKRISSLVVKDETGHPAGIVTERNMLQAMQSGCSQDKALREIMSSPVITVPESITTQDAYYFCLRNGIRHLVIVDGNGLLAGVASETDFRLHLNLSALAGRRKVASIARRSAVALPPVTSLMQALELMHAQRKSCVVVVEEEKPVGIVTERDVVRFYSGDRACADVTLGEAMAAPVLTIAHEASISQAAETMLAHKVRHLVMVDETGRMAGLLSEHDLTQTMVSGQSEVREGFEENFLRTLINALPDLVWLKDVDGVYLACNRRFERFFGAQEKDIVGKTDYDFMSSEQADFFRGYDRKVMESGAPSINEEWITYADDGHRELLETIKTPMRSNQGRLIGVLGIARDITGRVTAEESLRKLSAAVEQSAASVVITDLEARIQYVNPHFTTATGYSADEAIGQNPRILQSGQTPAGTYLELWGKLTSGQGWSGELLNKRKNGELYWEDVSIAPIKNAQGQATHYVAIKTEITERKRMEEALADSEHRYRTLIENSPFCIHEIDLQGRLQSMNHAGLNMLGLDEEKKICGIPYLSAVSEQDGGRIKSLLQDAINGTASHFEFAAAGDVPLHFKSCFIPIRDAGGNVLKLMGITEDITERKRIEDALYFIAQRSWQDRSEDFFEALVKYLGKSLGVDYVIVDRLGADPSIAETIALYAKGGIVPNMSYSLKGTPCENVMGHDFCCYRQGVQQLFPDDGMLTEMGIESYAGIPLWDSTGQALGLIAVMDGKPLRDEAMLAQLLRIVATRAAAELERKLSEGKLREQKEFLASIFENALDAVMLMDSKGAITGWSKQAEQIFGWSHDEAVGRLMHETIVPPRHREAHIRGMEHFLSTGEGPALNTRIEISALHRDGHEFPVELSISPIKTADGYYFSSFIRDISRRKYLEQQLLEREELFRAIFEQAPNGVELIDMDSLRFVEANPAACRMLGYTHDEYLQLRLIDTQVDLGEEALVASVRQLEVSGGATFENRHRCKNGDILDVEITARPLDLPGKRLLIGVWRNITESKRAEAALRESETKYRELFETAGDGIFIQNANGFTDCNEKGASMYGLTRAEVIGRSPATLAPEMQPSGRLSADFAGEKIGAALGGLSQQFEWQALRADGSPLDVEINLSRIELKGEICLQAVVRDISARKRAESALRESEEKLRNLFDLSPLGIALTDMTGRYVEFNEAFRRICGYTREELNALDYWALTPKKYEAEEARQLESLNSIGRYGPYEKEYVRKDGTLVPLSLNGVKVIGRNGQEYVWSIVEDVTESKRTEAELRLLSEAVRQCSEAIVVADTSQHFQYANPAFEKLFGYSLGELQGQELSLLQPDAAALQKANHIEKNTFEGEKLRRAKDGRNIPVLLKVAPFKNENDEVVGYIGAMTDITERKQAELRLQQSEAHFRFITESAQALIWMAGTDKLCTWFNKVWLDFTGRTMEQEMGDGWADGLHPDDVQYCYETYGSHFDRREPFSMEYRLRRHDGEYRWVVDNGAPRFSAQGVFEGYIGSCFDITDRKRAEENLRITASVFDTTQEAILITDANNFITDVNPAFVRITGYSREEVLGRNPKLLASGRHDRSFYAEMWRSIKQEKAWRGEIWNRRKSGETYAELLSISVICDGDGKVQRHVGVFSDISYLKEHEAALSHIAHYDALTGIPNRMLLADRMKQAIAQTSREQNMMAVCYLDLDGFKPVNDTLGHDAGDQVLIEIAGRLGSTIRGGDTVARLGGDEFVVLLLGLERGEECMTTLERLLAAIAQPILVKGQQLTLGASIGVSIYPLDDEAPDTLLRHADQAMYVAKQSGKNRFYIYDTVMDQRARNRHDFLQGVRNALEQSQFELYYQPKINLKTGQPVGAEALIRWNHPERGLLAPAEFLRALENTELDIEIGDWVIASALAQIDRWHLAGLDIEVSINISAHHLESPRFAERLRQHLARYPGMPPGVLQIEILETVALEDVAVVREVIEACRKFGVGFALDDFGTGYSSLSYLSSLPVDVLKIDQTFVRDMLEDAGDRAIVQGIIALARAFGRQTVAEGIELDTHYRMLLDMGCEIGQGYGIASPMPADDLASWLAERRKGTL